MANVMAKWLTGSREALDLLEEHFRVPLNTEELVENESDNCCVKHEG